MKPLETFATMPIACQYWVGFVFSLLMIQPKASWFALGLFFGRELSEFKD